MDEPQFDASTRIAGFALKEIKRALSFAGLMDKNDVAEIARKLECPIHQALHVVDELERQGFLTKLAKRGRVSVTHRGRDLVYRWRPPRQYTPIIARESEEEVCNEVFDTVPCGLWHSEGDAIMTEEAHLEAGIFVEQEGKRLIELSVSVPDDQDHPDDSANIETTVFMSVAEARRFARALQTAIEKANVELQRRADLKAGKRKRRPGKAVGSPAYSLVWKHGVAAQKRKKDVPEKWDPRLDWVPTKVPPVCGEAAPSEPIKPAKPKTTAEDRKRRAALTATLNELRGKLATD